MRAGGLLFPAWVAATLLVGCSPKAPTPAPPAPAPARCVPAPARRALDAFIAGERARYVAAITRARAFLDGLEVDPINLRAHGIKGKKKLVEALDAYHRLYQHRLPGGPASAARARHGAGPADDRGSLSRHAHGG